MAKKKANPVITPKKKESERRDYFINSVGIRVQCAPITEEMRQSVMQRVEERLREVGVRLEPPTYPVELLGGGEKQLPHDEKSIEKASDDDKAAWEEHLAGQARLEREQSEAMATMLALRGVVLPDGVPVEWAEEWQMIVGGALPPSQLKIDYVKNALILTPEDRNELTITCLLLGFGGLTQEAEAAFRREFQRQVESQRRTVSAAIIERTTGNADDREDGPVLGVQPDVSGREDHPRDAAEAA